MVENFSVRILALGSPHGDDQVAWRFAECLRQDAAFAGKVFLLDSPFQLIVHFQRDQPTILIDACQSGAVPGSVFQVPVDELDSLRNSRVSSHGGSVPDAIRMAEMLGRRPATLAIFAVEVASCTPGSDMTSHCQAAVEPLVHRVRAQLVEWERNLYHKSPAQVDFRSTISTETAAHCETEVRTGVPRR